MDFVVLIGRILYSLLFLASGLRGHFGQTDALAGYAEMRGVRPGRPLVLVSGVVIVAGALMVILGIWPDLGALLLAAFAFTAAFFIHHFWADEDATIKMNEQTQFSKDLALGGAGLVLFVFFATTGDVLGLQITGPLIRLSL